MTLDAYGTLFDLDAVMLPAVESVVGRLGLALDAKCVADTWTRRFHALHRSCALAGASGFRTVRDITEQTLGEALDEAGASGDVGRDLSDCVRAGASVWFEHVIEAPLYPEVREAVDRLASRFRLAVISDTDDDYFVPAWGLSDLPVRLVFTSQGARNYKLSPEGLIFQRAFTALGVEPGEVAHVGDAVSDVVGARAAGAQAVWLSRDGREWSDDQAEPTFIARDLAEAAAWLAES